MVTLKDIQQARSLLRNIAVRTPLVLCKLPDDRQIFIKPENLQPIGSFKLRGAYNKISSLTPEERASAAWWRIPAATMRRAWPLPRARWA